MAFGLRFGERLSVLLKGRYNLLGFDPRYVVRVAMMPESSNTLVSEESVRLSLE